MVNIGPASENYEPWYVRLNPNMVVPTLVHGTRVVVDSAQIIRYVDEAFEGPALVPTDEESRLLMEEWLELHEGLSIRTLSFSSMPSLMTRLGLSIKLRKLRKNGARYPELAEAYKRKEVDILSLSQDYRDEGRVAAVKQGVLNALDRLEARLKDHDYLAGRSYSLADVVFTVSLARLEMLNLLTTLDDKKRENVDRYYQRLKQRPSFEKAFIWNRIRYLPILRIVGPSIAVRMLGLATLLVIGVLFVRLMS
jgi:tetrachloro-p-hydroquinone reductive dehalogenase